MGTDQASEDDSDDGWDPKLVFDSLQVVGGHSKDVSLADVSFSDDASGEPLV